MPRNESRLTRLRKAMVAMVTPTRAAAQAARDFGVSVRQLEESAREMREALAVPADVVRTTILRANETTLSGNRYTVQALEDAARQINERRVDVQGRVMEGLRAQVANNSDLQVDFDRRMFDGLTARMAEDTDAALVNPTITVSGTDQEGNEFTQANIPIPGLPESPITWQQINAAQEALSKAEGAGQPRTLQLGRLMPELRREFLDATFARSAWINPPRTEHDADPHGRRRRDEARQRLRTHEDTGPTLREILEANGCNTDDSRYTPQQQAAQIPEGEVHAVDVATGAMRAFLLDEDDEVHYAR